MDITQIGNTDNVISNHGERQITVKPCDFLVEDCENLAETADFICKYGVNMVTEDGELLSGYDLIVKYYAGILAGLSLVLNDIGVTIPDELLKREMQKRLDEIKKES